MFWCAHLRRNHGQAKRLRGGLLLYPHHLRALGRNIEDCADLQCIWHEFSQELHLFRGESIQSAEQSSDVTSRPSVALDKSEVNWIRYSGSNDGRRRGSRLYGANTSD